MASNINTEVLQIDGMTCVSCGNRIEKELQSMKGITNTIVSYSSGTVIVTYDVSMISLTDITMIIEQLDYKVVKSENKTKDKTNSKIDYKMILGVSIIIFALYMVINSFGGLAIFNAFPQAEEGMGYGMLFIIGLLTSIHCVAMCGGLNLSQCIPKKKDAISNSSNFSTLRPSILYNLGRIISYTVVGGIVGALGSLISFSVTTKGIVLLAAGVFMVIMGLNMLDIFPWLHKLNPRMPRLFTRNINKRKNSRSPLYVGMINGLMPCGPLQTMQLYALSTGDPFKGAISMFVFSLGTVPLMFGLGTLSSLLNKKFTNKMMTASAVLVVFLGVFMFSNGMSLSGFVIPSINVNKSDSDQTGFSLPSINVESSGNVAEIVDGVQKITTTLSSDHYQPITVQKDIPVHWIIKAQAEDINGCNNQIVIPEYNVEKKLNAGDNIIVFTPHESGTFAYSCWMGMIKSKITVVNDLNNSVTYSSNDFNN